jgi:iron complex outermembrane receptor protein
MPHYLRSCLLTSTTFAAFIVSTPATAQVAAQTDDEAAATEIVVTAQHREENVQDISVSLATFSGEALNELGATDTASLTTVTSGVVISNILGGSVPTISIRGQGVGSASFFANQPNSAAINVDGVYLPSAIMSNFQIFDTERVEVLKGPQGTLYGRNTTAGAINFFSRKPSQNTEGFVQASYSRWNTVRLETGFGGPVSENLSYRLSAIYNYSDGDVINTYQDPALNIGPHRTNGTNRFAARAQLRYQPSNETDILFNIHGGFDRSDNYHYQILPLQEAGIPFNLFGVSEACFNQYRPTAPACLTGSQDINQVDTDGDNYKVNSNLDIPSDIDAIGGSLQIDQKLGNILLSSITAFDRFTRLYYEDEDGGPRSELHVYFDEDFRHYSQELRLASTDTAAFQWIVGGYASRLAAEMKRQADYTGAPAFAPWNGIVYSNRLRETSLAAFAHTTYDFSDQFRAILGVRYTYEKKAINVTNANVFANNSVPLFAEITPANYPIFFDYRTNNLTRKESWKNLSGKVGIEFRPNSDILAYAHVSRGFKSGGFPGSLGVRPGRLQPYRPEVTDSGEIGVKTNFANSRGTFNIAGFYTHAKDRLEFATSPDGSFVDFTNAASVRIKGIEAELGFALPGNLSVRITGAYTDAKYEDFIDRGSGAVYTGNRLPFSPVWTGNAQVQKTFELPGGDEFTLQTNASYLGRMYFSADNLPAVSGGKYVLWNGRAEFRKGDSGISAAVFVRNILDKEGRVGGAFGVTGNAALNYSQRRSIGVEAKYSW